MDVMPAKAGHPVRHGLSINHCRLGVLDHPLSRMMTVVVPEISSRLTLPRRSSAIHPIR
ncbi:hypothetical protein BRAS3843_1840003 [Bradyrhizobium sp. STM 3843]|nr:hypothetical protein BRAS3843_1840003 [Bradyrhizobium sp. STM 3843]